MSGDGNDSWDSYLDDEFESLDRASWDEEDWEQFLLRQDCLNAKYQELYETLRDHPDRDAIIAREMRWQMPEALIGEDFDDGFEPEDEDEESWLAREEAFVADLDAIAAYRLGQEFAQAVDRQLTARLRERLRLDEDAARTVRAAVEAAGHIASGHSIGYERDTLCGNIACCNRAQRGLAECFDGLLALRQRGVLTPGDADMLLAAGRQASAAVAQRITELRRRVWWC
jgi:hypothetical protein